MTVSKRNTFMFAALALMAGVAMIIAFTLSSSNVTQASAKQTQSSKAKTSKLGGPKWQLQFQRRFDPIRKAVYWGNGSGCKINKAARLSRKINWQKVLPKLHVNVAWNEGVSRWITFYPRAIIALEQGKKKLSKRLGKRGNALLQRASQQGEISTPTSSPNFDTMSQDLLLLKTGFYISHC